jgi:hypothetical protein
MILDKNIGLELNNSNLSILKGVFYGDGIKEKD